MRIFTGIILASLIGILMLGGCADRGVNIRPKGEMVVGGSVGH